VRRVAITGLGVFASTGKDSESFINNLVAGRSAVARIKQFDPSALSVQIGAEVPGYCSTDYFSRKRLDLIDRFTEFGLIAARQAMESSGLEVHDEERPRFGVMMGSGMGGAQTYEVGYSSLYARGATRVHPFTIPKSMHNAAASHICMEFGAQGPSLATSTACASAGHAIGEAYHYIRFGLADMVLAGGSDSPMTFGILRFWESVRVLASGNGNPSRACRQFSADREGLVLGEGAAVLVLEELEHAKKRGATIFAELAGYGLSSDASHITQPTVDGPVRAMRMAMAEAELNREDVDYINAHGTGTRLNDPIETQAIKAVLGDHARKVAISSTKSMHGHAMGATAALELAATVLAMNKGVVPPTANYTGPDPECDLDYVPNECREIPVRAAISNSFAFGGLNAVLAVRQFQ
jgi:nodulation protein E